MTPLSLDQLKLSWQHHRSALWWLGLLYRQPRRFENALKALKKGQAAQAAAVLYLHALPYIVLFSILGRWVLYSVLGFNLSQTSIIDNAPVLLIHSVLLILGIGAAMLFGIIMAAAEWINKGILMIGIIVIFGLIGFWVTDGNPVGILFAFDSSVALLLLFLNIFSGLTRGLAFTLVFGLVFGLFGVKFSGIGFGLAIEPHGVFAFGTCLYLALALLLPISITIEK